MYSGQDLRDLIKRAIPLGFSIIPVKVTLTEDGKYDKQPLIDWNIYKKRIATQDEVDQWRTPNKKSPWGACNSIGAVAGSVSGGLVCVDVDEKNDSKKEIFKNLKELILEQAPFLWRRLVVAATPSGGYHIIFKTNLNIPNKKLADRLIGGKKVNLIETRGEGGFFCIAPSPGYKFIQGKLVDVETLSDEESKLILECSKSLNEIPEEEYHVPKPQGELKGTTPIDDFNERATTESITEILQRYDWRLVSKRGGSYRVCRPGKKKGISGTVGHLDRRFYCFSASAAPFDSPRSYSAAAVLCLLEYSGDFNALAKALYEQGYGDRLERPNDHTAPTKQLASAKSSEILDRLMHVYTNGFPPGYSMGWYQMDDYLTLAPGTFNVVTGTPTSGKSEFIDQIMVNMSVSLNWRWAVCSPENYPFEVHWRKIVEKYIGKPMYGPKRMSEGEVKVGAEFIEKHFHLFDPGLEGVTMYDILDNVKELSKKQKFNGWVIDPWNELDMNLNPSMGEEHYTKIALREARKFSRRELLVGFLVAHPTKLYPDPKTGKYPVPTLYSISGAAHYYNKADNGFVIHRDDDNGIVSIYIQKVKFRWHGQKGKVDFTYNKFNGRYEIAIQENYG